MCPFGKEEGRKGGREWPDLCFKFPRTGGTYSSEILLSETGNREKIFPNLFKLKLDSSIIL